IFSTSTMAQARSGKLLYALRHCRHGIISLSELAPLCSWKDANVLQLVATKLHFEPRRVRRQRFPQGEMADEGQRAPLGVLHRLGEVRRHHQIAERLMVFLKSRAVEGAPEELCDHFLFGYSSHDADR